MTDKPICEACGKEIVEPRGACVSDPNYACATKAEWEEEHWRQQAETYLKVMGAIAGGPCPAHTNGHLVELIVRELVKENPSFANPDKWRELMTKAREVEERDYTITLPASGNDFLPW